MKNPITGKDLTFAEAKYVTTLRTIRRNAREDARSGNPAKRYPAQVAMRKAADLIRRTYLRAVSR